MANITALKLTCALGVSLAALLTGTAAYAQATDPLTAGRDLRAAGHAAEAVPLLQQATREHPQDADAWLNLGLAYSATGQLPAAKQALDRALAIAPDYRDARLARARLDYFREDLPAARARLRPLLAAHPDDAEALELVRQIDAAAIATRRWTLNADYSHGWLTHSLPSTDDAVVSLARQFSGRRVISGSIENVREFGRTDTYLEAGVGGPVGYLAAGGTPDADFRPKLTFRGGLNTAPHAIGSEWSVLGLLDASWARYPAGEVRGLHPGVRFVMGDRLALQARWINVIDERRKYLSGYAVAGEWQALPRARINLGWADAPESTEGVTVQVKTLNGGVALEIGDGTTLRLGATHSDRSAYQETDVALGVGRRF